MAKNKSFYDLEWDTLETKKKEKQINFYVQTEPQTPGYENRGILST